MEDGLWGKAGGTEAGKRGGSVIGIQNEEKNYLIKNK